MLIHINETQANEVHNDLISIYADLQQIAVHEGVSHQARCRAVSGLCRVSKSLEKMGLSHTGQKIRRP
jgi:hypothetical protein